ncbi:hypothetical protein Tco_0047911 [Tanacetum coccineum]
MQHDTPSFRDGYGVFGSLTEQKQRKDTEVSQLSGLTELETDDTENMASYLTIPMNHLHRRIKNLKKKRKSKSSRDEKIIQDCVDVNVLKEVYCYAVIADCEGGNKTRTKGSSKRAGEELESENLKKQKLDENVEAKVDNDQEEAEMKKHMEIVPDDEVAMFYTL